MGNDNKGGDDRCTCRVRDRKTREYIKEDAHLLAEFCQTQGLTAQEVMELLQRERVANGSTLSTKEKCYN